MVSNFKILIKVLLALCLFLSRFIWGKILPTTQQNLLFTQSSHTPNSVAEHFSLKTVEYLPCKLLPNCVRSCNVF